MTGVRNIQLSV